MATNKFQEQISKGIPRELPAHPGYDVTVSHAPQRPLVLSKAETALALANALRYFPENLHAQLAPEFAEELANYGRIYMYRYRPTYSMYARPIEQYPAACKDAAAIMVMIQNNLDPDIAQHPHELITYGGNGTVFQNWAQYLLTMQYLSVMSDEQTLVLYSGHPLGLFPSSKSAPRLVVTCGMMVPNYSSPEDYVRYSALGVTSYGQMTAGSFMYIGPQGIVHGTTITILNAARKYLNRQGNDLGGVVFLSSGLGGMSGAQAKAGVIAGAITVIAEIDPSALNKRYKQGWLMERETNIDKLLLRIEHARHTNEAVSIGYLGNIVEVWERLVRTDLTIELASDQTSLHNPYQGGYYPVGISLEAANDMMRQDPEVFRTLVHESLCRQVEAINTMAARGTHFWDYGNAFLLQASRAGAKGILRSDGTFEYPSYVEDIMGPMCFDYGFGPFRWVCTSGAASDLEVTDTIAADILEGMLANAAPEIRQQLEDNLTWIKAAQAHNLVVGSKARILYSNEEGRIAVALAFNQAIRMGLLSGPVVLGRDHHDVSGTDSPFRETANIKDGSNRTADMAVHNVIGDSFRGATWVSLHNGGGVGWGEVINGGFGMVLDGSLEVDQRIRNMLAWDVNNGIARRAWARNEGARFAITEAMRRAPLLKVTLPAIVKSETINRALNPK